MYIKIQSYLNIKKIDPMIVINFYCIRHADVACGNVDCTVKIKPINFCLKIIHSSTCCLLDLYSMVRD